MALREREPERTDGRDADGADGADGEGGEFVPDGPSRTRARAGGLPRADSAGESTSPAPTLAVPELDGVAVEAERLGRRSGDRIARKPSGAGTASAAVPA